MKKSLCGVFAVLSLWIASCATSAEEPSRATSSDEATAMRADGAAAVAGEATAAEPLGCGYPPAYCSRVQGTACFPEGGTFTCVNPGTCEFPTCYCTDGTWQCDL